MRKLPALLLSFILTVGSISIAAAATKSETFAKAQDDVISAYLYHAIDKSLLFREVKTQEDLEFNFVASEYLYSVSSFCVPIMEWYQSGDFDKEDLDSLLEEQASFLTETLTKYMDSSLCHEEYLRLLALRYETPMDKYDKLDAELKEKTGHTLYELMFEMEGVECLKMIHKAYGSVSIVVEITAILKEMEKTYGIDWAEKYEIR